MYILRDNITYILLKNGIPYATLADASDDEVFRWYLIHMTHEEILAERTANG